MSLRTATYREWLESRGARWTEWRGAELVEAYGDPLAEYRAVRDEGLGIADRSERDVLVISGDDAVPWLQGLVTNDLFQLAEEGSGQWTNVVNNHGRMIADLRILHIPEMLVVDLEPGTLDEGLMSHLRRHIIREKVKLADRTEPTARIGLYGRRAPQVLELVGEFAHRPADRPDYGGTWGQIAGADVLVQRIPVTGEPGYEIACAREEARAVWRALEATAGGNITPVGHEALELLRLEAGVPRLGVELGDKVIPLEAGLDDTISFEKGCYLGQEIIARLDTLGTPAKLLRTIVVDGETLPEAGAALRREGKKVGDVIRAAHSPRLGRPVALAFVKRDHNDPGVELDVEVGDSQATGRVEPLGYPLQQG